MKRKAMKKPEMQIEQQPALTREEEWEYAERTMAWYGWGSPIGLGFGLLALGVSAVLVRMAIMGF
ncbi:hypothetical protein C7I85_22560 [Mesorhizobium soli]|uniref:Uncharacterized protein n=2 Tax=Pseudaminobacter soli (ex Li et al. 2025) TaxID=1295366 RepID=A0A2P7S4G4_9HYPH|nr:hypothetical protein C7I85_22560 [Mesorhizobium soli]